MNMLGKLRLGFVAFALGLAAAAQAQEPIVLRVHHFAPASTVPHKDYLVPWGKRIEEASQGRLKVEIYPAMQLGGSPPSLYDQARNGTVDIVWTLPGYTPGRFPKSDVFEMPFMAYGVRASSLAMHDYIEQHAADEYADTRVLTIFSTANGMLHTNKAVTQPEDLRRMKIRNPTRPLAEMTIKLGAQAVSVPFAGLPEALSRGVIDGVAIPLDAVVAMRIHELIGHHTRFLNEDGEGLYANLMMLTMNKARYESLPAELQKVIDDNTGRREIAEIARVWEAHDLEVEEIIRGRAENQIHLVNHDEQDGWREASDSVVAAWIAQMDKRGLDGQALYDNARTLLLKHAKAK